MILLLLAALAQDPSPAGHCGSEIPWLATAEEAAAKAATSKRMILWYVPTVEGTAMDRKDVVHDYMMMGPWMMRDVVSIVPRKFVPLRMAATGALAKKLGIRRLDFIEPGVLFLTPDLAVVHRVDRISIHAEDWWTDLLRGVLASKPEFNAPAGEGADALAAGGDWEAALKAGPPPALKAGLLRRLRRIPEAREALGAARKATSTEGGKADLEVEEGRLLVAEGRWADALEKFGKGAGGLRVHEAAWYRGAMLHNLNRDVEGRKVWTGMIAPTGSPWVWKADAELKRRGPFTRGFENLQATAAPGAVLPGSTTRARKAAEVDWIVRQSIDHLLRTQRADGSWDDSTYVFGGEDSIPNVVMAVTASCCSALQAWSEVEPRGIKAALARARPFLLDEKNTAPVDEDEIIWAHAYRLDYLAADGAFEGRKEKMAELVRIVAGLQQKSGIWRHEYEAPFTTASVLLALSAAKAAGVEVPAELPSRGLRALAECRSAKGTYSYAYPPQPAAIEGSAGRMPLCELALLRGGASDAGKLRAAVDASFDRHDLLEKVRKYDDHADRWHNGGFFFWYDLEGRSRAILALEADRAKLKERLRDLVLGIPEFDGTFVDSHELRRSYGTAQALLTLKNCLNR